MVAAEALALSALEKSLVAGTTQLGKRLWSTRLSAAARRQRKADDLVEALLNYDFSNRLRIDILVPALPAGISLSKVSQSLAGPVYQGLVHELVAARLADAPQPRLARVH